MYSCLAGLRTTESIGFRCSLDEKPIISESKQKLSATEFIRSRQSNLEIKQIENIEKMIPSSLNIGSFLIKHETKYIGVIGQLGNNEEFNNIVSTSDPHMTIVLTWKAIVSDNVSTQRNAYGQHFVQLRNLYET